MLLRFHTLQHRQPMLTFNPTLPYTMQHRRPMLSCGARQVRTSNAFNLGMVAVLAAATAALGPLAMFKLYFVPYWVNVVWLDLVTYLHHHGPQDAGEKIPWYRGEARACAAGV